MIGEGLMSSWIGCQDRLLNRGISETHGVCYTSDGSILEGFMSYSHLDQCMDEFDNVKHVSYRHLSTGFSFMSWVVILRQVFL